LAVAFGANQFDRPVNFQCPNGMLHCY